MCVCICVCVLCVNVCVLTKSAVVKVTVTSNLKYFSRLELHQFCNSLGHIHLLVHEPLIWRSIELVWPFFGPTKTSHLGWWPIWKVSVAQSFMVFPISNGHIGKLVHRCYELHVCVTHSLTFTSVLSAMFPSNKTIVIIIYFIHMNL